MSVPTDIVCSNADLLNKSLNAFNMVPAQVSTCGHIGIDRMYTSGTPFSAWCPHSI